MSTLSEKSPNLNGGCAGVSAGTHENSEQEWHPADRENVISLPLCTNGQERASVERHPVENDHNPLQSPCAANKEPAQPAIEEDFALGEDASQGAVAVHEPRSFSHDATRGQQAELERLLANVHAVQREDAAARLPRAAQLASVPGLDRGDDGVWPSLEPEYLIRSRGNLRGPRTMIKIAVLIVSIFTVPIAYYFWMGGWDTPRVPTEMASLGSKFTMPPPMPLSEKPTTTIARGGDHRKLADGAQNQDSGTAARAFELPRPASQQETTIARDQTRNSSLQQPALPGTAQSTGSERQTGTPGAQDLPSTMAAYALHPPQRSSEQETTIARGEDPRTRPRAKSSAEETGATLPPSTPGAQDPPSSTARALDLPKPLTQQEAAIARGDDPRTLGKGEPRAAKSSQPGTPAAQDPPSSPVLRALDPEQIKLLMKQGEQFIAAGDVVTARIAFQRAAEAGDANAAIALGATYDPTALAKLGVVGISADVAKARGWYQKAEKLGSPDATRRLEVLAGR
jgi:hypothetical protein